MSSSAWKLLGRCQQPDDDLLAVHRGHRGHPGVDAQGVHRDPGPAVLREPPLGDVHPGDDLEPADDGRQGAARHGQHLAEHAVDPVADAQAVPLRLDVDVARAGADRVGQHHGHQPDGRRLVGGRVAVLPVGRAVVGLLEERGHVGRVLGQRPDPGEVVAHLGLGRHHDDELGRTGVQADVVQGDDVGRVADGQRQPVPVLGEDEHAQPLGDAARQQPDALRRHGDLVEVDDLEAELVAEGLGDLPLGGHPEVHQDVPEPASRPDHRALGLQGGAQLGVGEDGGGHQHVAQPAPAVPRPHRGVGVQARSGTGKGRVEELVRVERLGRVERGSSHKVKIGSNGAELHPFSAAVPVAGPLSSARRSSRSSSSWRSSERRKSRVATSPTAIRSEASSRVR